MGIKVEKWYDVCCDGCYKHLSTDYNTGMFMFRDEVLKAAREAGFKEVNGKTLCPQCVYAENLKKVNSALKTAGL